MCIDDATGIIGDSGVSEGWRSWGEVGRGVKDGNAKDSHVWEKTVGEVDGDKGELVV